MGSEGLGLRGISSALCVTSAGRLGLDDAIDNVGGAVGKSRRLLLGGSSRALCVTSAGIFVSVDAISQAGQGGETLSESFKLRKWDPLKGTCRNGK